MAGRVSIKQLLEAGVHFGHQTQRWNPKMRPYIFGARNKIHIIDLQQTVGMMEDALNFVRAQAAQGKEFIFVGTKRQAQDSIIDGATDSSSYYVQNHWLGGTLTNFSTIRKSIKSLHEIEEAFTEENIQHYSKKQILKLQKRREKLSKYYGGIRDMTKIPDVMIIIDVVREQNAVKEAVKLNIPIVALVDSNCDPSPVDYIVPGNDDAIKAIRLFCSTMSEAINAGREEWEAKRVDVAEEKPSSKKEKVEQKVEKQEKSGPVVEVLNVVVPKEEDQSTEDSASEESVEDTSAADAEKAETTEVTEEA